MLFRFIIVNVFSFVKRFFFFNAAIYNTIVFIPLLTVITLKISKKSLHFVVIISFILFVAGNITSYFQFIMCFLLIIAIPMFEKVSFEKILSRSILFFIIVSIYGIYQKFYGYTDIELNWIKSGLSFADEKAFLESGDIRPFSTFASMPEFTLFISIYIYYFATMEKKLFLYFSFVMLYIAGSRGVLLSTIVAYYFTFVVKKYNHKLLFKSFFVSFIIYLSLIFAFPIIFSSYETTSRMFAYGPFNSRVELINRILNQSSYINIVTGLNIEGLELSNTFDNIYFMLIAHFGIVGGIYFLHFLLKQKIDKKNFYFLVIFLGYGFYADMIFSYYLMFLFFFAIYSYSDLLIEKRSLMPKKLQIA